MGRTTRIAAVTLFAGLTGSADATAEATDPLTLQVMIHDETEIPLAPCINASGSQPNPQSVGHHLDLGSTWRSAREFSDRQDRRKTNRSEEQEFKRSRGLAGFKGSTRTYGVALLLPHS
jgi:hypothetical protein